MTFVETLLFIALALLIYRFLAPFRKNLEQRLYSWLRKSRKLDSKRPIIDITDYKKGP